MKKIICNLSIVLASITLVSCSRDFTETEFHQSELAKELTSVEQLQSFINGAYVKMRNTNYLGNSYRAYGELRSDEMYNTGQTARFTEYSNYTLTSSTGNTTNTWKAIYEVIGNTNIIINTGENLTWGKSNNPNSISKEIKKIKGQAYALRALATFDLLRLYGQKYTGGDLGVILPTTYSPSSLSPRATIAETEKQIENDFNLAVENIGDITNTSDKTYISPLAVKALMTRYYLYKKDYLKVAELTREIYNSGKYSVVPSSELLASFSEKNTKNSIFELALGLNGALGTTSYEYVMNEDGYGQVALLSSTIELYENGDERKKLYKNNFLNGKFPSLKGDTNIKVIRYEEVLLNGTEAELLNNNKAQALEYYNLIRVNRGLSKVSDINLDDIKKERIRELVGEGFRYWDLLRWEETIPYYKSNGERDSNKDKNIGDNLLTMPIPSSETNVPNTPVKSNPGFDN